MSLGPGHKLGPYEITSPLGAGGMGEVYRARDSKLKREVAIKVLPADVATDKERLARFQREAEVLASLNHPHIAHVYGFEDGPAEAGPHRISFLVMELVDGEDLSQRIARGPISIDEALPIAKQIAEALEAAHDAGIVHRDLKPANVKVREDGSVKVLDFGLAKAMDEPKGSSLQDSPTITSPAMTMRGVILGTAAYMSPEQAKGKAVDRRADIWAFGCVLYEMLTGKRAFQGEDATDTIAEVLKSNVDWQALTDSTPTSIRILLRRCLEKDPRKRAPHISIARMAIDDASTTTGELVGVTAAPPARSRISALTIAPWALAGALAIALAVIGFPHAEAPAADSGPVTRFELTPPEGFLSVGTRGPSVAISDDGSRLLFVAVNSTNRAQLFLREMSSLEAKLVPVPTVFWASMSWSPDGRHVVASHFPLGASTRDPGQGGPIGRMDPAGGPVTTLAEWGRFPVWGPAGTIVYGGQDGPVYRVAENGGASSAVTELDPGIGEVAHLASTFLPDGRRFLFMVQNKESAKNAMFIGSVDGAPRVPVAVPPTRIKYAGGWLWYLQDRTLLAHRFDPATARLEGGPQSVASGIADFTVSSSGTVVVLPIDTALLKMSWLDRQGAPTASIGEPGMYTGVMTPNLSRDNKRLLFVRPDLNGQPHVWQADLERNVTARLTSGAEYEDSPVYSPDGRFVVFGKGTGDLYRRAADGSGADELLFASPIRKIPTDISPDGSVLLFTQSIKGPDIWELPLNGPREPRALVSTTSLEGNAQFSPDGRWFVYCSGVLGEPDQIYLEPYPPTGARTRLSTIEGSSPKWSADGKMVYYGTPDGRIMRVPVTTSGSSVRAGVAETVVTAPVLFGHNAFEIDANSRILSLSPDSERRREPATVILNWPALLRGNAPH
jgi:Tol biopolymer transport system component